MALALLAVVLARTDVTAAAVADLRARASPGGIVAALCLLIGGMVFLALRWRALMPERGRVRVLPLTGLMFVGTLLNYAFPGPVGELGAAALASRRFGISTADALAAGTSARLVGLAMAGLVAGALFAVGDLPVPEGTTVWVGSAAAAVSLLGGGLAVLAARPALLRALAERTTGRVAALRGLHAAVLRMADALHAVGRLSPGRWAEAAAWALCGHGLVILGIHVATNALGSSPDPEGLAFAYAMSTAGAVVLFAFPGSQVGWDAMFASLLSTAAGVPAADAVAVALVVRIQQLLLQVGGAVTLLASSRGNRDEPEPIAR